MESLRFFYFDPLWMECLLDGVLSVGRSSDVRLLLAKAMAGNFVAEEVLAEAKKVRPRLQGKQGEEEAQGTTDESERPSAQTTWKITDRAVPRIESARKRPTPARSTWQLTGFILRSAVVSGWRGLEIKAYGKAGDEPLPILRLERISNDTMLCIFEGIMKRLVITEPAEGMHFGVESAPDDGYRKQIRAVTNGGKKPFDIDRVPMRKGSARVIEIKELVEEIKNRLGREALNGAGFAMEMVERPVRYTIDIEEEETPGAGRHRT
jgi:hypothetical protein